MALKISIDHDDFFNFIDEYPSIKRLTLIRFVRFDDRFLSRLANVLPLLDAIDIRNCELTIDQLAYSINLFKSLKSIKYRFKRNEFYYDVTKIGHDLAPFQLLLGIHWKGSMIEGDRLFPPTWNYWNIYIEFERVD